MNIHFRKATTEDIDFLVRSRLEFIQVSETDANYDAMQENIRQYFTKNLSEDRCDTLLAEADEKIIGTGIIFYYDSVPSVFNPLGKNAYITNMFVEEGYRRQGIGSAILNELIALAKARNYEIIILQPTETGKYLYKKQGFSEGNKGMILKVAEGEEEMEHKNE